MAKKKKEEPTYLVKDCTFNGPTINDRHLEAIGSVAVSLGEVAKALGKLASALNAAGNNYTCLRVGPQE